MLSSMVMVTLMVEVVVMGILTEWEGIHILILMVVSVSPIHTAMIQVISQAVTHRS